MKYPFKYIRKLADICTRLMTVAAILLYLFVAYVGIVIWNFKLEPANKYFTEIIEFILNDNYWYWDWEKSRNVHVHTRCRTLFHFILDINEPLIPEREKLKDTTVQTYIATSRRSYINDSGELKLY